MYLIDRFYTTVSLEKQETLIETTTRGDYRTRSSLFASLSLIYVNVNIMRKININNARRGDSLHPRLIFTVLIKYQTITDSEHNPFSSRV